MKPEPCPQLCIRPDCISFADSDAEFFGLCEFHDEIAQAEAAEEDYYYRKSVN